MSDQRQELVAIQRSGGQLRIVGDRRTLRAFTKEVKKHRTDWVMESRPRHKSRGLSLAGWTRVADEAVAVLIDSDTAETMSYIVGLPFAQDEVYAYLWQVVQIMASYDASIRSADGRSRDPIDFREESQRWLAARGSTT